jgi:hypothetical protein
LDQYPTHFSARSRHVADELNIRLIAIPKGGTAQFQPLDRKVFGPLKAIGAHLWSQRFCHLIAPKPTTTASAELLLQAWNRIKTSTVQNAWTIPFNHSTFEPN